MARDPAEVGDLDGRRPARLRILVVRSGGFAGLTERWTVEDPDHVDDWIALLRACPWGAVGVDATSRDRFVWRIEAHTARRRQVALVPDRDLTGPWRSLVERVRAEGRAGDG
jgi:hypothetical protein